MPQSDKLNENSQKEIAQILTTENKKKKRKNTNEEVLSQKNEPAGPSVWDIVDNANKYFLLNILSPEITANEAIKRDNKGKLITIIKVFLIAQFAIVAVLVIGFVTAVCVLHAFDKPLTLEVIKAIIGFINLYIASIVVELIAMLKYIMENVFDTSITTLVELYKDNTNVGNDAKAVEKKSDTEVNNEIEE